jgi:hypothetical protein
MIGQYREVLYGLAFGLGASAIDIAMHVHLESHTVQEEVVGPHAWITVAYRGMFMRDVHLVRPGSGLAAVEEEPA